MELNVLAQSFSNAFTKFSAEIAGFLPNFIATVFVVFVGLYISKLICKWVAKLIDKLGFNALCKKLGIETVIQTLGFKHKPAEIIGKLLHVFLVLIIVVAASESLGLGRVSSILDQFIMYLPKLFGAMLITLIGLFIAKKGKAQLEQSLDSLGVEYGASAGRVLQILVLFVTFSLVIGQLELETALLNTIFTVIIASLGVALALALGLGTKSIANSIVSGIYAREQLMPGDEIELDGFVGNVVSVSTVNTIIENSEGKRLSIPNQDLLNSKFITTQLSPQQNNQK